MVEQKKAPPTQEQSLNNISWHLKKLVEQIEMLNNSVGRVAAGLKLKDTPSFDGDF